MIPHLGREMRQDRAGVTMLLSFFYKPQESVQGLALAAVKEEASCGVPRMSIAPVFDLVDLTAVAELACLGSKVFGTLEPDEPIMPALDQEHWNVIGRHGATMSP